MEAIFDFPVGTNEGQHALGRNLS
jgi:hypothetical protein